ncbi:MAG TPA: hypothetical protein VE244_13185 [Nitrososphaeraceae archaeon]|nr:hypothetical protein [Nitrososphaeraceae archaeon]
MQSQYIKGQEEEEEESISNDKGAILLQVRFIKCPIKTSLRVLGKKWTLLR